LQVVQRGASNAYFPAVVSALDIRSEDDSKSPAYDAVTAHVSWTTLIDIYKATKSPTKDDRALGAIINIISSSVAESADTIWQILSSEMDADNDSSPKQYEDEAELLREEWGVLLSPPEPSSKAPFVVERVDFQELTGTLTAEEAVVWAEFQKLVESVVLAKRIRIVRAFTGFRRLDPSGEMQKPGLNVNLGWLPAIEIYGEGVFLSLNQDAIKKWEALVPSRYTEEYMKSYESAGYAFLPEPSPRFILLHTLAHLLIRQLCFECGYSASSLTERIYCDNTMAGILIYTASSDSEGALGGLVREAQPERFYGIFKTALYRSSWCSNDPICSELPHQGIRGLNRAACHACTLVAETSCAHANALLDRGALFGNDDMPGFFENLIKSV